MKKLLFLLVALLVTTTTFATTNSLPENCEYGRSKNYDPQVNEVASAIRDGFDVYQNPYSINEWLEFVDSMDSLLDSFDYLRYEGPKHVLQGQSFRAKANLFDVLAYVNFHNSEKGYVGRDKSNYEANSYHHMSFDTTHGYGLAWVSRGGLCSAEGVWVQKLPEIRSSKAWFQNRAIYVKINYFIDSYARAAKDSSVPVTISIWARDIINGGFVNRTFRTDQLFGSKVVSFDPKGGGSYEVSANVNDGTFSMNTGYIGLVEVPGPPKPPCPNCEVDY